MHKAMLTKGASVIGDVTTGAYLPSTLLGAWGALASGAAAVAIVAISQLHQCIHLLLSGQ